MHQHAIRRIHSLWDRVTDLGATGVDEALELTLAELSALLDAQHCFWMGALRISDAGDRDPVLGWRPRIVRHLVSKPEREAAKQEHCRRVEEGEIDPSVIANLRDAGRFRVNIKHELVSEEWFQSEYYQSLYEPFAMRDIIYVVTPLGEEVESWFAFERDGSDKPLFGQEERELLDYAVRPMKWFHRQLVLHYGVVLAEEALTRSERRVLNGLLTEMTEAAIAKELALSPTTVHSYCTNIYRKFGVRGRPGLTALWLGRMDEIDAVE